MRPLLLALLAALATIAVLPAAAAAAPPDHARAEARGPGWAVTRVPGGFEVTVELDEALPVTASAPGLAVDGVDLGPAVESADGTALTVLTTDPAVATASEVEVVGLAASGATDAPPEATTATAAAPSVLDADPGALGELDWTEATYAFGDRAIPLLNIGGVRGELEGRIYLPEGGEEVPTVVLLHGRHSYCYGDGARNPERWPCKPSPDSDSGRIPIPSYLGYDATARALASNGYAVVSISANAINANDSQLADDLGAQSRGQLVLDSLALLADANAGDDVAYHDTWTDTTVTLDEALDGLEPADLVGRFDLDNVGIMGHSRGGEGVMAASTLNDALPVDEQFGIRANLPLAPVDYNRFTNPNVAMATLLPYCDGDVENLMGQHAIDDSRHAFDDDVLRSAVVVMGGNHNYFNTIWTPGLFPASTSDDWRFARSDDPECDPDSPDTGRLTDAEQRAVGAAYMAGFFRLVLGGEEEFLPLFDGSDVIAPSVADFADVRSVGTQPASARIDVDTFEYPGSGLVVTGDVDAQTCQSMSDVEIPLPLPLCATTLDQAALPHWSPARQVPNVPASPMLHMTWESTDGDVAVTVPTAARDLTGHEQVAFKLAADEFVTTGTDLVVTLVDGSGGEWSMPVSALNPLAVTRMPGSTSAWLRKVILQQVTIPVAELDGLDVTDLVEVRFGGAVGADGTPSGGVYLSDLAVESSAVGDRVPAQQATVDLVPTRVEEGDAPGTAELAVVLSEPLEHEVTAYVSADGASDEAAGLVMEPVVFAPGETCLAVDVPTYGDEVAGSRAESSFRISVTNSTGAVMGTDFASRLVVREDDGVDGGEPAPPVGVQGDACAEYAASLAPGDLEVRPRGALAIGQALVLTAGGYRPGETVDVALGDTALGTVLADDAGVVALDTVVPEGQPRGRTTITATGVGSALVTAADVVVRPGPVPPGRDR